MTEYGGPEVLTVRELPEPQPGPGEVSIDVAFAGVNYTDVRNRVGDGLGQVPFVPGVEVAGTVRATGPGVTGLQPGQPVAALTRGHGYAEVVTAAAELTVPLPANLAGRPESGSMFVTVQLALMLLRRVARVQPEETVLLHGAAGGVGTVTGQLARHWGLRPLLGTVSDPVKTEFAQRNGFAAVYTYPDFDSAVLADTGGRGVDVVLDPVGGEIRARSFGILAPFGRLVTYSNISREPEVVPDAEWMRARCVGYAGFSGGQLPRRAPELVRPSLLAAAELVSSGVLDLGVSEVFPLARAADAHRVFERRAAVGKLILAV
ncbi:MAG TPA: zinc-binding dehydrogenase [Streptosporangiaceae bacterium]|nr:zinc-binding dehydrogenase [Streptosporangiaceae bacterium]